LNIAKTERFVVVFFTFKRTETMFVNRYSKGKIIFKNNHGINKIRRSFGYKEK